MAKTSIQMPASSGGIMRYFNDYKSKFLIKPGHVILFAFILIFSVIILHATSP